MKKWFPLLALLVLAACNNSFKTATYEDVLELPLPGSDRDTLFFSIVLDYVTGGVSEEARQKMNEAIVSNAFDLEEADPVLEQIAVRYRENLIDEYLNENEELAGGTSVLSWADELTGAFGEEYQGWRNYTINYYSFRGGAHGYNNTTPLVFDSKSGDLVLEADLFQDGYEEPLSALMRKKVTEYIKGEDESLLSLVEMSYVEPNENFSVGPDGVQWLFQADEIWPHAFGPLTVTLSWDELAPFLKK